MRNQAQLITYVDRLGGDLTGLRELLTGPLDGAFGGVHLLPFFTPIDGADAGFDPIDHREVDPRLGAWTDVEALGTHLPIMADLILNHVSSRSPQFLDFLARGDASPDAGMFLTLDKVFPRGATESDLLAIYRPRPGLPFTPVRSAGRSRRIVWTTFTSDQIDVDVRAPATRSYLEGILDRFAAHGIRMVRLDAVGYAVKTPGTSCFMTPETFAFIDELTARAHDRGIEVLVEVHAHWRQQVEISRHVDRVYDFALPALLLHALDTARSDRLRDWLRRRPQNVVTVLDTHDGIGIVDVGPDSSTPGRELPGLLDVQDVDALIEGIHERTRGASRSATGDAAANVDLYQVNCTYLDALGGDERAYLIARMIQLWVPGVPQIYYVGLLAGHNDVELLRSTGVGRDINRHHYTRPEIERALDRPLVRQLLGLLRLRNNHPAFDGTWELLDGPAPELTLRWATPESSATLHVDLERRIFGIRLQDGGGTRSITSPSELTDLR